METRHEISTEAVLETLNFNIEKYYLQLRSGDIAGIDAVYHARLMGWKREITFISDHTTHSGILEKVDADGRLCVRNETGLHAYRAGAISIQV